MFSIFILWKKQKQVNKKYESAKKGGIAAALLSVFTTKNGFQKALKFQIGHLKSLFIESS